MTVDPNETLARLRAMVHGEQVVDGHWTPEYSRDRLRLWAEQFDALDQWMSKGGFRPADWVFDDENKELATRAVRGFLIYMESEGDDATVEELRWEFMDDALEVAKQAAGIGVGADEPTYG